MQRILSKKRLQTEQLATRVPQIVLSYWAIKIASTTLGETGADHFSMTLNLGYAVASLIFLGLFLALLTVKLSMRRYEPIIYWLVFTSTSIAGTAMCDFIDRTLGVGYTWGSFYLTTALLVVLAIW